MKTRNLLVVVTLLLALVAPMAVSAQEPKPVNFPQGFCDNADGVAYNPDHPLPEDVPCVEGSTYDLVNPVRKADKAQLSETLTDLSWTQVQTYEAGIIWAHPPKGTAEQKGKSLPTAESEKAVELQPAVTDCASQVANRDNYLRCLDKFWRDGRAAAWLGAIGVTGLLTEDARQPDEYIPAGGPQTVRGVQVTVQGAVVKWPGCITTDVRQRFETSTESVVYEIPNTVPTVFMATNVTGNGPISVWANCTDWPEMVALVKDQTVTGTSEYASPYAGATPTTTTTATPAAAAAAVASTPVVEAEPAGGEEESYSQDLAWPFAILFLLIAMVAIVGFIVARRREGRATDRLAELEAEIVSRRTVDRQAPLGDEGPNV